MPSGIERKTLKERNYQKEFCNLIDRYAYRYSRWQIWNDFLYLTAVALANVFPVPEREEREKQYLLVIGRYTEEEQKIFPEMLTIVTLALDENPEQDFLGSLYHRLELQQEQKGQFFTPYDISRFMAEIQFAGGSEKEELERNGYISVNDPACGAGAMLIAFANAAKRNGLNYQKQVLFVAQDIDHTAAMMCYIQLSLLGCPAVVIIGDTLVKPMFHPDNEVWYTPFYHLNRWRFSQHSGPEETAEVPREPEESGMPEEMDKEIRLPENMEFVEGMDGQFTFSLKKVS